MGDEGTDAGDAPKDDGAEPHHEVRIPAAEQELHSLLRSALIGGRWALFLAEISAVLLRLGTVHGAGLSGDVASLLLILYNLSALFALYRLPHREIPVVLLLSADVAILGALVSVTGGLGSPFTGLYYLVVLLGAVYYDLRGGLAVAVGAVAVVMATTALNPELWADLVSGGARTQFIPYLLLHGAVAGYLVRLLKRIHERRVELEEDLQRARHEEALRRHEAEVAREIQRATLPEPPPHPHYETAVHFIPAGEVGGDFYAFFSDGERLGVAIGDVSGKGIPAALVSIGITHLVHWLRPLEDPDRLLAAMNRNLEERLPEEGFASMLFALLHPARETITLYNAGHLPALILGEDGVRSLHEPNFPLGAIHDAEFSSLTAPFRRGETLLLYSDACIEVRNEAGAQLGIEGLSDLASRHASLLPEALSCRLVKEIRSFGKVTDDLTLVVVRAR